MSGALATVERAGPLRLGDVAAAEKIAPSTLTRLVTVLEEHGYVKRCAVPGDARAWTLVVTPRGHEVLDRIRHENTLLLADSLVDATRQHPELANVLSTFRGNVPAYNLKMDVDKLQTLGVPVTDAYNTLQTFLGGLYVNDFIDRNRVTHLVFGRAK